MLHYYIYIYYDILYYTILCTHQSTLFDLVQATYLPLNFSQPKVCFSKAPGKEIPQVWRQLPLCRVGLELTGWKTQKVDTDRQSQLISGWVTGPKSMKVCWVMVLFIELNIIEQKMWKHELANSFEQNWLGQVSWLPLVALTYPKILLTWVQDTSSIWF
jgi:hypothetical protein